MDPSAKQGTPGPVKSSLRWVTIRLVCIAPRRATSCRPTLGRASHVSERRVALSAWHKRGSLRVRSGLGGGRDTHDGGMPPSQGLLLKVLVPEAKTFQNYPKVFLPRVCNLGFSKVSFRAHRRALRALAAAAPHPPSTGRARGPTAHPRARGARRGATTTSDSFMNNARGRGAAACGRGGGPGWAGRGRTALVHLLHLALVRRALAERPRRDRRLDVGVRERRGTRAHDCRLDTLGRIPPHKASCSN